jgi:hypothetical protein
MSFLKAIGVGIPECLGAWGYFGSCKWFGSHEVMFSNPVGLAEKMIPAGRD